MGFYSALMVWFFKLNAQRGVSKVPLSPALSQGEREPKA
jgi:hypothetical protein